MDLASVVAALASVGVRVSGSTPNNNIQGDSSRACPTGLAGPEPSGTHNDPGQHFQPFGVANAPAPFGELMNKIWSILRRRRKVQELISRGVQMEAHIDDVCLGTNTQEDHLILFFFLDMAVSRPKHHHKLLTMRGSSKDSRGNGTRTKRSCHCEFPWVQSTAK